MQNQKIPPSAILSAAELGAGQPAVVSVPWDPQSLKGRDCGHCACYFEQSNPQDPKQSQGFCRRLPADLMVIKSLEERLDHQTGKAVIGRDGKPVMQPANVTGYLFKTTKREGTCFDGWRPLGTLPGERQIDTSLRFLRHEAEPLLADLPEPYRVYLRILLAMDPSPKVPETSN
jgi:hypothetical protein